MKKRNYWGFLVHKIWEWVFESIASKIVQASNFWRVHSKANFWITVEDYVGNRGTKNLKMLWRIWRQKKIKVLCCKNSRVWIEKKIFTFKQHCTKSYITCFIIISIVFFFISIRGWHSDFKFLLTVTGISEWSGIRGSHFWTLKNT